MPLFQAFPIMNHLTFPIFLHHNMPLYRPTLFPTQAAAPSPLAWALDFSSSPCSPQPARSELMCQNPVLSPSLCLSSPSLTTYSPSYSLSLSLPLIFLLVSLIFFNYKNNKNYKDNTCSSK